MATGARSPREDARRNREAILRAADAAFAHVASIVPLREIARRAKLGRATVYRHFPDRHALATAIADDYLDVLRKALGQIEDERYDFRFILYRVLSIQAERRPLSALIRELPSREQYRYLGTLIGLLTPRFEAAQASGELRGDITPADLELIFRMLDSMARSIPSDQERGAAMTQLITIVLDGLFTSTPST